MVRDPVKADFPTRVEIAKGDLLDIDALRSAFKGVRTLFLLNAVAGDEFTQALITLNTARECGVERVVHARARFAVPILRDITLARADLGVGQQRDFLLGG